MPWHYDHHMGKDQNSNWCVTHPLFDMVLGTRKEYLGVQPSPVAVTETPVGERASEQAHASKQARSPIPSPGGRGTG